jgi:hypothetical protein
MRNKDLFQQKLERFEAEVKKMGYHIHKGELDTAFDKVEELFDQVKMVLFPELQPNQSISYNGSEFIGNVYQIYRTILHQLAIDNNWDNVYSSPALPSGTLGTIKIEKYEA